MQALRGAWARQLLLTRGAVGGAAASSHRTLGSRCQLLASHTRSWGWARATSLASGPSWASGMAPLSLVEPPSPNSCGGPLRGPRGGRAPGRPFLPLTNPQPLVSQQNVTTGRDLQVLELITWLGQAGRRFGVGLGLRVGAGRTRREAVGRG